MIIEKIKGYQAVQVYPDGWSCVCCGDSYTEKTIDAEDFYVIHTEHGTECLKCVEEQFPRCNKAPIPGALNKLIFNI